MILIRKDAPTDPALGCVPAMRSVEKLINYGVVNIDKPAGPTSHQVSAFVQDILHIKKSGHSGTLDPGVTGVLPIAIGRATRIVQALLPAGKEYVALMHLHKEVPESQIRTVMNSFVGKIMQLPPQKSAVKRQLRERNVYGMEILEITDGKDVLFRVGCQAGTYIRKLIHDIGQKLGCGAHMVQLKRTKAGPFDETTVWTLHELSDAYYYWKQEGNETFIRKIIVPIEQAVAHLPKIWVFDTTIESMCHGADLKVPGISKVTDDITPQALVCVMTLKDELVALGQAKMNSKEMCKDSGIAVLTKKVFMEPGTYAQPILTN